MRETKRHSLSWRVGGCIALLLLIPQSSLAENPDAQEAAPPRQAGEDRWIASLAITSGATIQDWDASSNPFLIQDPNPSQEPRLLSFEMPADGDDRSVVPFVGGSFELMSPALPIPTRPRVFVSVDILPTFADDRNIAVDGDADCVRGPLPDDPCATDEDGSRSRQFGEVGANGTGSRVTAHVKTMTYGANLGLAFPVQFGERQLRIKPSFGWINYEVEAEGIVVNAACDPVERCTTTTSVITLPPPRDPIIIVNDGFLRQPEALTADDTKTFNGIGPGLDIEVDTGKIGPIGSAIFLGARAYHILGDRKIKFGTRQQYDDVFGMDVGVANFEVEVDPWVYRTHVGIRFMWIGDDG